MKITITRSFSKKIQVRQFEPVDAFCAVTIEGDLDEPVGKTIAISNTEWMQKTSEAADRFCREEVQRTLEIVKPELKPVKGKSKAEMRDVTNTEAELDLGNTN